ncbi:MAG: sodium:proton antiporter [Lachnospiraceae bacterium]|nr:sodium:proton antiporter [Lachnospiraceae bacterium]
MTGNVFLLLLILWPFVASLFIFLSGADKKRTERIALSSTIEEALIAAAAIWLSVKTSGMPYLSVPFVEGFGLSFRLDGFRIVYLCVTVLMWFCSTAASLQYFSDAKNNVRYYCLSMWTFAATLGVFVSADLLTTFTFFEIMSLASYAYVAHTEKKEAMRAAETYLAVAVIGGLVMLMGLLIVNHLTGTLDMGMLKDGCSKIFASGDPSKIRALYAAGGCILFGFGAKAGMFPLHIWLPKAHPVAPAPASALLSGVLTKCGIFGVLILVLEIFAENFAFGLTVVLLGTVTMLIGAILAVFSVDLKRTLACSSVSQIGFILIGCGLIPLLKEECTLALSGAMLYMVNHSLFKLTLFLCAAAIYMNCHMLNLNDLKGYGRDLPVLKVIFAVGALGISGVPMLSGYVSKTLIHEGLVEYIHEAGDLAPMFKTIEILFLVSGGMTFAYMMKIFHAVFVDKPDTDCKYAGKDKSISMLTYVSCALPAALILLFGAVPKLFVNGIARLMGSFNTAAYQHHQLEVLEGLRLFSWENLKGSLISLGIGTVFFILIRLLLTEGDRRKSPVYLNRWPSKLDLEELVYRPLLTGLFPFIFRQLKVTELLKAIWKGIMAAGSFIGRLLGDTFAVLVDLMRVHVFKDLTTKRHPRLERMKRVYIRTEVYYKIVSGALSFGLMLICIGLTGTLIYLLYLMFR